MCHLEGEHAVEVGQLLAQLVVVALDTLLRLGHHARHLRALDRLLLRHAQQVEQALDALGAKEAEDAVIEAEEEVR